MHERQVAKPSQQISALFNINYSPPVGHNTLTVKRDCSAFTLVFFVLIGAKKLPTNVPTPTYIGYKFLSYMRGTYVLRGVSCLVISNSILPVTTMNNHINAG